MFCTATGAEVQDDFKALVVDSQHSQSYLLALGFHCCFEFGVEIAKIL